MGLAYLLISWGGAWGVNVGIYGSPMECPGYILFTRAQENDDGWGASLSISKIVMFLYTNCYWCPGTNPMNSYISLSQILFLHPLFMFSGEANPQKKVKG